jgi:hypothetical protein
MNPGELLEKLSPAERMDMIMKGFRPGDIKDVKRYRNGERTSLKEREEKAQTLAGNFANLGGAGEREIALDVNRQSIPLEEVEREVRTPVQKERNVRQQLNEEMDSYSSTAGRTFNTNDILSLKRAKEPTTARSNKNSEMIANEGFTNAKEYLNAFVLNLQNENPGAGYQLRINLFKLLKKCLEAEGKYKGDPVALKAYRMGVVKAEKALYKNLTGE